MIRIFRCTQPLEALRLLSDQIELLIRRKPADEPFTLALSGGETAKALFSLWNNEFAERIDWGRIHFYWVDERCVPPSSSESNFAVAHKLLLGPLGIPPQHIFRIRGEANPLLEAQRYADTLLETLPQRHATPQFDAMILGAGADGHTASIFPDNPKLITESVETLCAVTVHPHTGQQRITLTGKVIFNSKALLLPIIDPAKAPLIHTLLDNKKERNRLPAGYVISFARNLSVYTLATDISHHLSEK